MSSLASRSMAGLLGVLALSFADVAPHPARASPGAPTAPDLAFYVHEASLRFGIPEDWIRAVMHVESAGAARATSTAGAMGLMQVMPATWRGLARRHALGADPYEPRANILAGTAYLREMLDRYGEQGFLAAYNAGPGRYEAHLFEGRALPAETRAYVARLSPVIDGGPAADVARSRFRMRAARIVWTRSALFVARASAAGSREFPQPGANDERAIQTGDRLFIATSPSPSP